MRNPLALPILAVVFLAAAAPAFDRPGVFGMNPIWAAWTRKATETWEPAMFDRVAEAGATCVRIGLGWDHLEPERLKYDFAEADRLVELALERNLEVVGLWVGCATYATSSPVPNDREKNDLGRWMPKEENAADFERVTRVVAAHYRGRIHKWEFWNEANHLGMSPQPAQTAHYAPWLRRAYTSLKEGNPDCIVGTTGTDGCDVRFFRELYELGYGDSFDAAVVHPYSSVGIDAPGLAAVRRLLVERGDAHKPIWITEFGWTVDPKSPDSLATQAENVRRSYDILLRDDFAFVELATFHTICDFDPEGKIVMGLCDIDLHPRPAFVAYQECVARKAPRPETAPEPLPVHESLVNGGFESGDLSGWTTYGRTDGTLRTGDHGVQASDGNHFWGAIAGWDVKYGGIKQSVAARPGRPIAAQARVFTTIRGGDDYNVAVRVGIDPTGGSDPIAFPIVWTDWTSTAGQWQRIRTPAVEATADRVTVFVEHRHSWPVEWNQTCADEVELVTDVE